MKSAGRRTLDPVGAPSAVTATRPALRLVPGAATVGCPPRAWAASAGESMTPAGAGHRRAPLAGSMTVRGRSAYSQRPPTWTRAWFRRGGRTRPSSSFSKCKLQTGSPAAVK